MTTDLGAEKVDRISCLLSYMQNMIIVSRPVGFEGYCRFMKNIIENIGYLHTDLFCVHSSFLAKFLHAVSDAYQAKPRLGANPTAQKLDWHEA